MRRERRYRGSKWEPGWVRRYGGGQTDQGEVLDLLSRDFRFGTSPLVTSASGTLRLSRYYNCLLLRTQAPLSVESSKWGLGEKPVNLKRELGRKIERPLRTF